MRTAQRRSFQSAIPGYSTNAVLQLIVASGIGFVAFHFTRVVLMVAEVKPEIFPSYFVHNLALPAVQLFPQKLWTVFTYGWTHDGFWELFSNMIWLYCFGSIVQTLVGYKQVIPMFTYALITGGLFYECSQLIPSASFQVGSYYFIGAQAGVVALAVAALTLSPSYRFFLGEHFSIPIGALAAIFFILMLVNVDMHMPSICLLAGGALTGLAYVWALRSGYAPGAWVYNIFSRLDDMATPDDRAVTKHSRKRVPAMKAKPSKQDATPDQVDLILDKINQHGYNSLTKEEKEILLKAGKENN